jgi:hypothetical protein
MPEIDLDALEATARAATHGPWQHTPFGGQNQNGDYFGGDVFDGHGEYLLSEVRDEDGAHIATFDPTTALALIARLREAEAVIAEALASIGDVTEPWKPMVVIDILSRYKTTKTEGNEP